MPRHVSAMMCVPLTVVCVCARPVLQIALGCQNGSSWAPTEHWAGLCIGLDGQVPQDPLGRPIGDASALDVIVPSTGMPIRARLHDGEQLGVVAAVGGRLRHVSWQGWR